MSKAKVDIFEAHGNSLRCAECGETIKFGSKYGRTLDGKCYHMEHIPGKAEIESQEDEDNRKDYQREMRQVAKTKSFHKGGNEW